jgi:hypothetical protein
MCVLSTLWIVEALQLEESIVQHTELGVTAVLHQIRWIGAAEMLEHDLLTHHHEV